MKTDVFEISSVVDGARLYGYLCKNGQPHNLVLMPGSGAHHSFLVQYPRLVGRIITGFINDWKRERELNHV